MTNSENNAKLFLDSQNPAFDWIDYEEQMLEKELIFDHIDYYSDELKRQTGIESVFLRSHEWDICDNDCKKDFFRKKNMSIEKQWLNRIKKYYVVQLHSNDFQSYINSEYKSEDDKKEINAKIELETWKKTKGEYFEWLVSLFLLRFVKDYKPRIDLLKNQSVQIEFIENKIWYLWYQKSFTKKFDTIKGLQSRPDFIVSNTNKIKEPRHIIGVVECKYFEDEMIDSKNIRDIFTKGYELRPYFLWLFSMKKLRRERKEIIENYGIEVFDEFRNHKDNEKDLHYKNHFDTKLSNSPRRQKFLNKIKQDAIDKINMY